jgi:hypothetical protein
VGENVDYPIIANHIEKINMDIKVIVEFYRKRSLMKRALIALKLNLQQGQCDIQE